MQMQRSQLKHITRQFHQELAEQYQQSRKHFDMDGMHEFRVVYKKLRAFLRMMSFGQGATPSLTMSKKLRKAYQIAGLVRDAQLQQQRIIEAAFQLILLPHRYLVLLQKEIDRQKPLFAKLLSPGDIKHQDKKVRLLLPATFSLPDAAPYFQDQWVAIRAAPASGRYCDQDLHSIRKRLKDVYYNQQLMKKDLPQPKLEEKRQASAFYKTLLEELGSFQDMCTAIALLDSFGTNRIPKKDRQLLEVVKTVWLKNKTGMKQLLLSKLAALPANPSPA